jgi:hypothetical protein
MWLLFCGRIPYKIEFSNGLLGAEGGGGDASDCKRVKKLLRKKSYGLVRSDQKKRISHASTGDCIWL